MGSARSEAALIWALQRASGHKLPVIAVYAVDDRWMAPDFQWREAIREAGLELLQKAQDSAHAQAPEVEVEIQLRHGSAGAVLMEASKDASMLVVGDTRPAPARRRTADQPRLAGCFRL